MILETKIEFEFKFEFRFEFRFEGRLGRCGGELRGSIFEFDLNFEVKIEECSHTLDRSRGRRICLDIDHKVPRRICVGFQLAR